MNNYNKLLDVQNNNSLSDNVRSDASFKLDTFFSQTQQDLDKFFAKADKLIEDLKDERNL